MDKNKLYLIAAPAVVSLICIVLAVNATSLGSQLNTERAKAAGLNTQVISLGTQLASQAGQAGMINDLQGSLDAARRDADAARGELDAARREVEGLRAANSNLEVRLSAQAVAPVLAAE
ncbi:MAG: hypothetical protein P9L93_00650 [Candidatus Gorgyraea atricola]|nr:hypothetical protein [Candidatus Gorgyraea atricola]